MADWSGTARSNYFEVKDLAAFKTWLESHSLSLLEDDADPCKPSTKVGFTAANTDHGAWPSSIWNEESDENRHDLHRQCRPNIGPQHPMAMQSEK